MSSFRSVRSAMIAAALVAAVTVSGCSLSPVYSAGASGQSKLNLTYAEPSTRLEQVFYRYISAGLAGNTGNAAPRLSASIRISNSRIGLSDISNPVNDYQIVATVTYRVIHDGSVIADGTRHASSGYQTTGQIVADQQARSHAEEQAVRAAADQVRLALITQQAAP